MKPKRFSHEQISAILREHEAGVATAVLCRNHGISSASLHAWKAPFGAMDVSDALEVKALTVETVKLKRLLADLRLGGRAAHCQALPPAQQAGAKRRRGKLQGPTA